jgi:hypothetical protein
VLVWLPLAKGEDPPMTFSESLAERIRQALARKKSVEEKKMFGGVGFLLNSNMSWASGRSR